jgi:DNA-binding MarR family transcriptional regulator/GNAT superfamily N-acetyltransferase
MGAMSLLDERIRSVREFNRFFTAVIGVLDEGLLHSPYTLTEARVIFELAQRDATEVVDLRRRLDLDAGYLSRILVRFEADGLVRRERSDDDGRRQVIRLSEAGINAFEMLDARSAAQIADLLSPLADDDQRRVVAAMGTVQDLLGDAPTIPSCLIRPLRPGDLGWVVHRHGALYADEYGLDQTFEALVARVVADYVDNHDPRFDNAWIAEVDGAPVGSIFCVREDDQTAHLRLLLVEPTARGLGIGVRLVDECVQFARNAGYRAMTLWTIDVLTTARRIYQQAGFELVDEEKRHSFGRDLVGQRWRLQLAE